MKNFFLIILFVLINCIFCYKELDIRSLKKNVDPRYTTLSGISSGAYFALQLQFDYSRLFVGSGIVAGGPFYCSQNNALIALGPCMKYPWLISVTELVQIAKNTELTGFIDPTKYLFDQKVYLFSGTKDTIVDSGVVKKTVEFYEHFIDTTGAEKQIIFENSVPSEHAWINNGEYGWGNMCDTVGSPYINKCSEKNVPFNMMSFVLNNHKYGLKTDLKKPEKRVAKDSNFYQFSQKKYVPSWIGQETLFGLDNTAYIYVPTNCSIGSDKKCKVHLNFHGCEQSKEYLNQTYVYHNDLNDIAELNDIIIIYPQSHSTELNPNSCWDWWGYSGTDFASNIGIQPLTIRNILRDLGI